jgi:hypothetical protein
MARSTGPMIAVGAVTLTNEVVFNAKPVNWRVPLATGVAAIGLALLERVSEELAVGIAYVALVTVLFAKIDNTPAPAESFLKWWNEGK